MTYIFNKNFDFEQQNTNLFRWLTDFSKNNPSNFNRMIIDGKASTFTDNLFKNAYLYDLFSKVIRKSNKS